MTQYYGYSLSDAGNGNWDLLFTLFTGRVSVYNVIKQITDKQQPTSDRRKRSQVEETHPLNW